MSLKAYQTPFNLDLARLEILEGARTSIRNTFGHGGSSTSGRGQNVRSLQNACPSRSPLSVSSSLFPSAEGCYVASDTLLLGGEQVYFITSASSPGQTILASPREDTDDDDEGPSFWGMAYVTSSVAVLQCASVEDAASVNPADATWMCDESGTANFQLVGNGTQFTVDCGGCSSATPSPTAATTAAPAVFTGGDNCGVLTVSAPSAPFLEGCYIDARYNDDDGYSTWYEEQYSEYPGVAFTEDGFRTSGQLWLSGLTYTATNVTVWGLYFFPSYASSTEQLISVYCFGQEEMSDAAPANTTWSCDLDGDSSFTTSSGIDETQFAVVCGCATTSSAGGRGTLSASPTPAPTLPAAPTPSPTTTGCKRGDPFLVTLPAVPQVEGCYVSSNFTDTAGKVVYWSGGAARANGQSLMLPSSDPGYNGSFYGAWRLVYFESEAEKPTEVCHRYMDLDEDDEHPALEELSHIWDCDFEGTGNVTRFNSSSSIFRIECGCSSLDFSGTMSRANASFFSLGMIFVLPSFSAGMGMVFGVI